MPIQLFVPTFDVEECLKEIRECLEKGWTGLGYKTVQFEEEWKNYTSLPNAHFLNSATAGLNLAFEIFKEEQQWEDDCEVITSPLTFVSTNHAILLANLKPVFADIDDTLTLSPVDIEGKITDKTRAVLFIGIGGNTGNYPEVVDLCKKYRLKLILDAAHMSGTRLNGEIVGKEADCVVYSFQAVKNLPTGDSGMICFKDKQCDEIARKKTWLGINKDTFLRSSDNGSYKWKYDVEYVGYKSHGNAIMASIALAQLKRLDFDNAYRRQLALWYRQELDAAGDKIKFVDIPKECESSTHLFQIMVRDRDGLIEYLRNNEIYPGVHYVDNTCYNMYSYAYGMCPQSLYISEHVISLPLHLRLSYKDIKFVSKTILEKLQNEA